MGEEGYDYLIKIVIIGSANVGKSSLLLRYIDDIFENAYVCTIGVDFKVKTVRIGECLVKM
jgi:Ras-related protein Rab-1A